MKKFFSIVPICFCLFTIGAKSFGSVNLENCSGLKFSMVETSLKPEIILFIATTILMLLFFI